IRSHVAAPRSAAKRHRWWQRGRETDRAVCRRRIYGDSRRRHICTKPYRRFTRARVNTRRMAHTTVAEHFPASVSTRLQTINHIKRQDRRELLHRKRMLASDTRNVRKQTSRARRHRQTRHLRDHFHAFTDDRGIERTLWSSDDFSELLCLCRRKEMRALEFELFAHSLFDGRVAHDCLLGCADRAVVETLARQNILHCLRHVRSSLDAHRHVAWSNSKRRLA